MKKLSYTLLTVVMLLSVTSLFAQGKYGADSANCVKYLNFYRDYYRQNNYQDAAGLWRKAMESCPPTASQNMLIHGRQIMTYLINTYQGAPEGKQALVDSLLMISDIRAQYYPSRKLVAMENKAFDMVTYEPADNKEVLSVLDESDNPSSLSIEIEFTKDGPSSLEEVNRALRTSAEYLKSMGYEL